MLPIDPPALVEVNARRQYVNANESACRLLGYTLEELRQMRIEDISFPSGAHVRPMFERYRDDGELSGLFAVRTKSGEGLWIRYRAKADDGRLCAEWTEYEPISTAE
ncbi:MAG TPA: PAS domain-containing protein [Candidatus Koribacter sp.]|jgi:PAS domain S-box-containing protein